MKNHQKILLFTCLFLSFNSFSQTSTEKWNSLSRRYEYFDQRGYMTGYKEYNSLRGTWDFYSTNQRQGQVEYNKPVNPYNTNLVERVLAAKQGRYDANVQRISNEINRIGDNINNYDISDERKQNMHDRFNSEYLDELNSKKRDLSNNNLVTDIINWMYTGINKIVKEE